MIRMKTIEERKEEYFEAIERLEKDIHLLQQNIDGAKEWVRGVKSLDDIKEEEIPDLEKGLEIIVLFF